MMQNGLVLPGGSDSMGGEQGYITNVSLDAPSRRTYRECKSGGSRDRQELFRVVYAQYII